MTNAELAILSLIAEKPRHGYDIEQVIEERGMRNWTEVGFSSIYYLLYKLEKDGLIESQLQRSEGKGPARKEYSINQHGRQSLVQATIAALSTPQSGSSPFLLGLSNYPIIPKEQILTALNTRIALLDESRDHMLLQVEEQGSMPSIVAAMFDYSQVLVDAELNWLRKFIQKVEAGNV